jgi:hypothetical protein
LGKGAYLESPFDPSERIQDELELIDNWEKGLGRASLVRRDGMHSENEPRPSRNYYPLQNI